MNDQLSPANTLFGSDLKTLGRENETNFNFMHTIFSIKAFADHDKVDLKIRHFERENTMAIKLKIYERDI